MCILCLLSYLRGDLGRRDGGVVIFRPEEVFVVVEETLEEGLPEISWFSSLVAHVRIRSLSSLQYDTIIMGPQNSGVILSIMEKLSSFRGKKV